MIMNENISRQTQNIMIVVEHIIEFFLKNNIEFNYNHQSMQEIK